MANLSTLKRGNGTPEVDESSESTWPRGWPADMVTRESRGRGSGMRFTQPVADVHVGHYDVTRDPWRIASDREHQAALRREMPWLYDVDELRSRLPLPHDLAALYRRLPAPIGGKD